MEGGRKSKKRKVKGKGKKEALFSLGVIRKEMKVTLRTIYSIPKLPVTRPGFIRGGHRARTGSVILFHSD